MYGLTAADSGELKPLIIPLMAENGLWVTQCGSNTTQPWRSVRFAFMDHISYKLKSTATIHSSLKQSCQCAWCLSVLIFHMSTFPELIIPCAKAFYINQDPGDVISLGISPNSVKVGGKVLSVRRHTLVITLQISVTHK